MEPRLVVLKEHAPQVVPAGELVVVDDQAGDALLRGEPGVWEEETVLVPPPPIEAAQ